MSDLEKLCPCGSKKLYFECCGANSDTVLLEQIRWRRAGRELRRKLGEYADQPSLSWDAARAQDLYLGTLIEKQILQDDDFTMERCFEWFIFDFRIAKGATLIERFHEEYGWNLDYWEKSLLEEWLKARISLYEVLEVHQGRGLLIKDLLFDKRVEVRDISAATEIKVGNILLIRILRVGEEYEFSTSGLALPNRCKDQIIKVITTDREHYNQKRSQPDLDWEGYLKDRSHKINTWVMETGMERADPRDKLPVLYKESHTIRFPLGDWRQVWNFLKNAADILVIWEARNQQGAFKQALVTWLGEKRGPAGLQPIRGKFLLTTDCLMVMANSPKLLTLGRQYYFDHLLSLANPPKEPVASISKKPEVEQSMAEAFSWPAPGYAAIAAEVRDGLEALGFDQKQQWGAMKLWYDYCTKEQPAIGATAAWTAAVIYAFTRLEEDSLRQQDLAGQYGVSSSTISNRYMLLRRSLDLVAHDQRYSTKDYC